jgi:hypothetical protein
MTVIAFESKSATWRKSELADLLDAFAPVFAQKAASGWETASTEHGHPQFYLLGPKPDQECILCISRIGHAYIVNDGEGHHLVDLNDLGALAAQVQNLFKQGTARMLAKLIVVWCGAKQVLHDKLDPVVAESEELLSHFVPQLAALA